MAHRLVVAAVGVTGLVLLAAARNLEPDPRGFGTHEQLGFSPCYFYRWTGHLCPTCGATTAWSHTVRGEIVRAAAANLGGVLSCLLVAVAVPWLLLTALLGNWMVIRPHPQALLWLATAWFACVVLDWIRRVYFG